MTSNSYEQQETAPETPSAPASENVYPAPAYYPQPPAGYQNPLQYAPNPVGAKHAQNALLFGILAFVVLGVVFGPLAIIEAKKAEALGEDANVGKILGWVATILSGLVIVLYGLFFFIMVIGASASSY